MNDKVAILEDKGFGFFRVTHCGSVIADFLYCTGSGEQGYMTRDSAKKLAIKLARKIENSTTIKTKKGFKLLKPKGNDNDQR